MDKIIQNNLEKYPLNGKDVLDLCKGKVNVLRYSDLQDKTLDQILGEHKACIILIEYPDKQIGHWVLLFQHPDGVLEYYNSFGFPVDYPNKTPIIQSKLYGLRVIVNNQCLQSKKDNINTCGRYCVLRLNYKHLDMRDFNRLLTQNKAYNSDFWVSVCTQNFLDF